MGLRRAVAAFQATVARLLSQLDDAAIPVLAPEEIAKREPQVRYHDSGAVITVYVNRLNAASVQRSVGRSAANLHLEHSAHLHPGFFVRRLEISVSGTDEAVRQFNRDFKYLTS